MSSQRSSQRLSSIRRRRSSSGGDGGVAAGDDMEHAKEIAQVVLAGHARKGGLKEPEVRKALKDAVKYAAKTMKDVTGCVLTKESDHHYISYKKVVPLSAQGSADIISEAKQGLLSIVLMFLHMSKNPIVKTDKVKEMALWEFLEMLEVRQTAAHPVFGLPTKLIAPSNAAEFVSQGWLSFEKKSGERGDSEEIYYDWGPKAYAVLTKMEILEAYCEVVGDKPETWKEHYKQAKKRGDETPVKVERRRSSLR